MANFDEDIKRITEEVLQDGTVDKIIREKVINGFESAIESAFRYGDLRRAIEKRVKDVMVPFIENFDMSAYTTKLDCILSEIVNSTTFVDNKKILGNFRELMCEPEKETITVSELFNEYKKYVSKEMDTDGRDVEYDETPRYAPMEVSIAFEEEDRRSWSCFDRAVIELSVDDEEQQEKLNRSIRLDRYEKSNGEGWHIYPEVNPEIRSLRYLDDFDILLIRLHQADVKLIPDIKSDYDNVYSENEPEATYE